MFGIVFYSICKTIIPSIAMVKLFLLLTLTVRTFLLKNEEILLLFKWLSFPLFLFMAKLYELSLSD